MLVWPVKVALTRVLVKAFITSTVHVFNMLGLLSDAFKSGSDIFVSPDGRPSGHGSKTKLDSLWCFNYLSIAVHNRCMDRDRILKRLDSGAHNAEWLLVLDSVRRQSLIPHKGLFTEASLRFDRFNLCVQFVLNLADLSHKAIILPC